MTIHKWTKERDCVLALLHLIDHAIRQVRALV
jgi:hypothetical protein